MAINYPGPWDMRFYYTVLGRAHVQKLNVNIVTGASSGLTFDAYEAETNGGGNYQLDTLADDWAELWADVMDDGEAELTHCELWKYTPDTFDAVFWATYPIARAGDVTTGTVPASQWITTFRTQEGGVMKVEFLDTVFQPGARQTYAGMSAQQKAITDFVISVGNPFLARDTSYPWVLLGSFPGQSEALFKEIYR